MAWILGLDCFDLVELRISSSRQDEYRVCQVVGNHDTAISVGHEEVSGPSPLFFSLCYCHASMERMESRQSCMAFPVMGYGLSSPSFKSLLVFGWVGNLVWIAWLGTR